MPSKDPAVKYNIRVLLDNFLYGPVQVQLDKKLDAIMEQHSKDDPHQSKAFMYKGEVYAPPSYRSPYKITLLSRKLFPQMEEWVKENQKIQDERLGVSNYFTCVLNESKNTGELFAYLPECLVPALSVGGYSPKSDLSKEKLIPYSDHHKASIQTIKERVVLNMLL